MDRRTNTWVAPAVGISIAGLFLLGLIVHVFFYEPFRIPALSMHPALAEGSYVLIKKHGYGNYSVFGFTFHQAPPSVPVVRGDILIFISPNGTGATNLKRIVGLPGERLVFRERRLSINDQPVPTTCDDSNPHEMLCTESFGELNVTAAYANERPDSDFTIVVPADQYFVLGDNRNTSSDSRFFGAVPAEYLMGKVIHTF